MAPTAQEVALGWAIELITVSSELKGDAKMKILNALTPKLQGFTLPTQLQVRARGPLSAKSPPWHPIPRVSFSPDGTFGRARYSSSRPHSMPRIIQRAHIPSPSHSPPSSLSFRFACSSTPSTWPRAASRRSTRTFRRRCSRRSSPWATASTTPTGTNSLSPSGLVADVYGETILSCLRGDEFDLALVRDRLEEYDVEDICRDSRWVSEREFLNTRQSVGRLVASLRAGDDAGKRDILLSGYRAPALILADLGAYAKSVIEALGPSFLEGVAEDVAQGAYSPLAETVDRRPTGLLVPDDAREAARLTADGKKRSRVVELARAAGPGSAARARRRKGRRKEVPRKGKGRRPARRRRDRGAHRAE